MNRIQNGIGSVVIRSIPVMSNRSWDSWVLFFLLPKVIPFSLASLGGLSSGYTHTHVPEGCKPLFTMPLSAHDCCNRIKLGQENIMGFVIVLFLLPHVLCEIITFFWLCVYTPLGTLLSCLTFPSACQARLSPPLSELISSFHTGLWHAAQQINFSGTLLTLPFHTKPLTNGPIFPGVISQSVSCGLSHENEWGVRKQCRFLALNSNPLEHILRR